MSVLYEVRDVFIPAGATAAVNVQANVLTPLAADGDFEIAFGDQGSFSPLYVGVQIPTPGFERLRVRNMTSAPNTVRIAFSAEQVRDQRFVSAVPIDVKDGFQGALEAGRVFYTMFGGLLSAPPSGKRHVYELANPAGSGRMVQITGFAVRAALDMSVTVLVGADSDALNGSSAATYDAPSAMIGPSGLLTTGVARPREGNRSSYNPESMRAVMHPPINAISGDMQGQFSTLLKEDSKIQFVGEIDEPFAVLVQWMES